MAVQRRCVQLQLLRQGVVADFELVEQLRLAADRPVSVSRAQLKRRSDGQARRLSHFTRCATGLGLVHVQAAEAAEFNAGETAVALEGRAGKAEFGGARIWWRIGLRRASSGPNPG